MAAAKRVHQENDMPLECTRMPRSGRSYSALLISVKFVIFQNYHMTMCLCTKKQAQLDEILCLTRRLATPSMASESNQPRSFSFLDSTTGGTIWLQ